MTTIDFPPISVNVAVTLDGVQSGGGGTPGALSVPPIAVRLAMPLPTVVGGSAPQAWTGTFDVVQPADNAVVATATPTFTVAIVDDSGADFTVQIMVANNTSFTGGVTFSSTFDGDDGGTTVTPSSPLPSTTYWKARLLKGNAEVATWTTTRTLTIATAVTPYELPVTWTVSTGVPRPIHLWHFDPAGPNVNDRVTIYGQGFPANPATAQLTWGTTTLAIVRWELVDATAENAADSTRLINADDVTPEHYEVAFIAPKLGGGLLSLEI